MKIRFIYVGKTEEEYLITGIDKYQARISRYISFSAELIPALKNTKSISEAEQKEREGELILKAVMPAERFILLDERGTQFDSPGFANEIQKNMNSGLKSLVFVVGGPYGFSDEVYSRANGKISLSRLTFSHQMVRLFFMEQVYRAFTILKEEPYHHK
jgi:23S rRNA (pseudouridine1915-N3)-methyltransferase